MQTPMTAMMAETTEVLTISTLSVCQAKAMECLT
jgi:hypothetical protein